MFVIDKRQLRVGFRFLQYRRYLVSISMAGNLIEMLTKFIYNESKLFKKFIHELNSREKWMISLIGYLQFRFSEKFTFKLTALRAKFVMAMGRGVWVGRLKLETGESGHVSFVSSNYSMN